MDKITFFNALIKAFQHTPTSSQEVALQLITDYLFDPQASEKIFLLKGFAGTGKTSITNCLIKAIPLINHQAVLLAPTGRAAKVMSSFAKKQAFTIHKYIYYSKNEGYNFSLKLRANKLQNTLFIVDEASLISDISDLILFVNAGHNCKLLLIGDSAQLPPIGVNISPALDPSALSYQYHKEVISTTLTQVLRQKQKSTILRNATLLRKTIFSNEYNISFQFRLYHSPDFIRLTSSDEVEDAINEAYNDFGADETAIIVRSNKRAMGWNSFIRRNILSVEDEIAAGDLLMVVKNNYFWSKDLPYVNFIANGDTLEVLRIHRFYEEYGFRFAEISAQLIDYPSQPPFDTYIILNTLYSENPTLTAQENQLLYQEVLADYIDEPSAYKKHQLLKDNPFYNALQVKFSYAITCHKSQGGQWETVIIEKPFLPQDYVIDESYYRWLYTALTRAKSQVYLVGFNDDDFQIR